MKALLLSAAVVALGSAGAAQEETTMTMEEVPAAVMEAAEAAIAKGVTFEAVALDDGVYEFSGSAEGGMGYEIDVTEDGAVKEIEASELPEAVSAALESNLAGFTPEYVERSRREAGAVVYGFEGTHEGAAVDEDGSNSTMSEDAAG